MKFSTCIIVMALTIPAGAQSTLTTYYVIPPTGGCNGLWALGPWSDLYDGCTGPYMFDFQPFSCVDMSWGYPPFQYSGDTILIGLCSLPCDFYLYSADTNVACLWCSALPSLGLSDLGITGSDLVIHPNPVGAGDPWLTVDVSNKEVRDLQIINASGRAVLHQRIGPGRTMIDIHDLSAGAYLLRAGGSFARFVKLR